MSKHSDSKELTSKIVVRFREQDRKLIRKVLRGTGQKFEAEFIRETALKSARAINGRLQSQKRLFA